MIVRDVMTQSVECIAPSTTIREAAQKMGTLDVGPLPVCDNDRLVGMLTDRDIAVRAVAQGADPNHTAVRDVMSRDIFWCFEDEDVRKAAQQMKERQVRRLLVLNRDKRLVGIVSLGDLAVETGDEEMAGQTLEAVSQPSHAHR
ncbi:MAG: CBS domain-containing protein [Gemmataceae bacterium]|nr:CBS domain-containing protein [Gemmataceae bacterium]